MYMPDNKFYRQLQFQLNRSFKKKQIEEKAKYSFQIKNTCISKCILDKNVTIRNEIITFLQDAYIISYLTKIPYD